jgi:hypothetical protein
MDFYEFIQHITIEEVDLRPHEQPELFMYILTELFSWQPDRMTIAEQSLASKKSYYSLRQSIKQSRNEDGEVISGGAYAVFEARKEYLRISGHFAFLKSLLETFTGIRYEDTHYAYTREPSMLNPSHEHHISIGGQLYVIHGRDLEYHGKAQTFIEELFDLEGYDKLYDVKFSATSIGDITRGKWSEYVS